MTAPQASPELPAGRITAKYVLMLGSMCALGAISTDIYLPSLPQVALDLGTSASSVQLTMTAMLIGNSIGQLVIGPMSDRFGRRRPVLIGVLGHIVTSAACVFAPDIVWLIAARALQGFCNAAAGVVAMAVIRDRFIGRAASRLMSRLLLVIGVAPLFAPSLGGFIASFATWRGVFGALALYGLGLFVVVWLKLPETLAPEQRLISLSETWRGYGLLARDRRFLALAVLPGLVQAILMSYVVGSPFTLQIGFGLSPFMFSLVFALNGAGLVLGAQVSAGLVKRFTPAQLLRFAVPTLAVLTGWLFLVSHSGLGGLPLILVSLFVVVLFINFCPPNASALAMARHGSRAGTAAALVGALQSGLAGLISPLVGLLGESAAAMSTIMWGAALAALAVLVLGTPIFRRGGAQRLDSAGLR
ncbi:MAG: multidrug effflux MFS transporter [Propionibacteriaceae bacterium]|jgi:DHA1 family bicyclomycin/chloramphenicol resistance-like MFS transporter|nr:multidrug effflux MFS transporter [Propionibacteriaceae bacterium]